MLKRSVASKRWKETLGKYSWNCSRTWGFTMNFCFVAVSTGFHLAPLQKLLWEIPGVCALLVCCLLLLCLRLLCLHVGNSILLLIRAQLLVKYVFIRRHLKCTESRLRVGEPLLVLRIGSCLSKAVFGCSSHTSGQILNPSLHVDSTDTFTGVENSNR